MDDDDIAAELYYFAHPLPPDRRDAFCSDAEAAVMRLQERGPGLIHRTIVALLPGYFVPIPDGDATGIVPRQRASSPSPGLRSSCPLGHSTIGNCPGSMWKRSISTFAGGSFSGLSS
jgi:hypothetical protein